MIKQICTRCVMDTTDPNIYFDEHGVCNYCRESSVKINEYRYTPEQEKNNLEIIESRIKSRIRGEYDSILGLSGGVDSSYLAYLAMNMGLNPLCVHFDNGWNSDIAVRNIRNIIDVTGFDLYTYVIDWPEFRDLQRSFIRAGVMDIEMLTDHAIFASLFKIRKKHNIATVLSGTNYATEHGTSGWSWPKMDAKNIKAIHDRFGELKIKSFPLMSSFHWALMRQFGIGGKYEQLLNSINYKKNEAISTLSEVFEWQYYGGKHYESIFTKFYQAYMLPNKFDIDKRKLHLSALIHNNEISRDYALSELDKPLYDPREFRRDKMFVLKKLGFSEDEFDRIMLEEPVKHDYYPTDQTLMRPLINLARAILGHRSIR